MTDWEFMSRALELAQRGRGFTSPNPMVGAVIVKDGRIIGEGYHARYGESHAEVMAVQNASEAVAGATLYCNLEPCCPDIPRKKTPPCTDLLIREKISRVVAANLDPNPYVNGRGVRTLREAGISVETGILSGEGSRLNEKYFKFISSNRPFVHLKIAQSLDGRIATSNGHSQWITNQSARRLVHQMRAEYDAVLVGAKTVLKDDPSLTVREVEGRNPRRVVLDDQLVIPDYAKILSNGATEPALIFTTLQPDHPRAAELIGRGHRVLQVTADTAGHLDLEPILEELGKQKISSLLVEGGGEVFTSFVKQKAFDKISIFIAPLIIGNGIQSIGNLGFTSLDEALRLEDVQIRIVDGQALVEGYARSNQQNGDH